MNSLVVYFSQYGNTQAIAEGIADCLASRGSARAINLNQLTQANLAGIDLFVAGSPTYRMALPRTVRDLFKTLPKRCLRGVSVAAFDTSYKMSPWLAWMTASKSLLSRLRALGGRAISRPETFYVKEGHEGSLYDGETERARAWAADLLLKR